MNPVLRATANGVRDDMHGRALSLRRFDVSVDIHGSVAKTTVEASFANASPEQLEGDFHLALPQGAVISGYAPDIAGQMTDGVLVDRPRAQAVNAIAALQPYAQPLAKPEVRQGHFHFPPDVQLEVDATAVPDIEP